jgi:hypothetical protein
MTVPVGTPAYDTMESHFSFLQVTYYMFFGHSPFSRASRYGHVYDAGLVCLRL